MTETMNDEEIILENTETLISLPTSAPATVTSSVYSADIEYLGARIDYQTNAIHIQFAVLILVLIFLKVWKRGGK